jgi:hypothetical protein
MFVLLILDFTHLNQKYTQYNKEQMDYKTKPHPVPVSRKPDP